MADEPVKVREEVEKSAINTGMNIILPLAMDFLVFFGAPAVFRFLTGKKKVNPALTAPLEAIKKEWQGGDKDSAKEKMMQFISSIAPGLTLSDETALRSDVMLAARANLCTIDQALDFLDWLDQLPDWQQDNIRGSLSEESDHEVRIAELAEVINMTNDQRLRLFKGSKLLEKTPKQRADDEVRRKGAVLDRSIRNAERKLRSGNQPTSFLGTIREAFTFKLFK